MRRLARVLFNVLTALSLLLCVGACATWARSWSSAGDVLCIGRAQHPGPDEVRGQWLGLASFQGRMKVWHVRAYSIDSDILYLARPLGGGWFSITDGVAQ